MSQSTDEFFNELLAVQATRPVTPKKVKRSLTMLPCPDCGQPVGKRCRDESGSVTRRWPCQGRWRAAADFGIVPHFHNLTKVTAHRVLNVIGLYEVVTMGQIMYYASFNNKYGFTVGSRKWVRYMSKESVYGPGQTAS